MQVNRRRKRSNYTALSLQYWLAAVARRTRTFALVLADTAGLLIASTLHGPEAEELAALAPLLARGHTSTASVSARYGVPVSVNPITVDGMPMLLCAVGEDETREPAMVQAVDGVSRILAN